MIRHYLLYPLFYLLILAGCVTKPVQQQLSQEALKADLLMKTGQHKQAAVLYGKLSQSNPEQYNLYNLLAAEAFIQSADSKTARYHADKIDLAFLSEDQRNRFNLIYGQIYLSNGEAELALNKLNGIQPYQLNQKKEVNYYQSLAFAHSLTGNSLQSVQARLKLNSRLQSEQRIQENHKAIIATLETLPEQTLIQNQPPAPDELGGWMALTYFLKNKQQNQNDFLIRINEWKQLFPDHPANKTILQSHLNDEQFSYQQASTIALLLPESGRYADAATAIKDGFMAAYHEAEIESQPQVRFYDSNSANITSLYQQAVLDGAGLVIGPLQKDNIKSLALNKEFSAPVLALNHVPGLYNNKLYQFGLSPIDEAIQLANKASQDNNQNVLILTPAGNSGDRTAGYLAESWEEAGGTVLESQSYQAKQNDFSKPIKDLLNLNESNSRYRRLKGFLGRNIEYTDRRRKDVDAIFLSATAKTARSIYPQLRFFRATRIPVYATPNIYNGNPNSSLDRDLNNIVFCDIPWLFDGAYQGELSKASMRNSWEQLPRKYIKLIALGIDSFNIIDQLGQLENNPYSGASGILSLNAEKRITRELVCAKFKKGIPALLN